MEEFDLATSFPQNRREFLKRFGGGIFILFTLGDLSILEAQQRRRRGRDYPTDFNAYLRIGEDGRVSCFTGKIEMGQGIFTSLAQMLAEELDVPLDSVDMVMGDTVLCPYDGGTTGSRSTKYFGPPLRKAAATARAVLLQLAAEQMNVPLAQLVVNQGVISDQKNSGQKITYAQLAKGKKIVRELQGEVAIKDQSKHTISGKATLRTDSLAKVIGEAKFTGDIRLPNMLYASILRPPAHGAKLKSVDISAAQQMEGVKIIQDGDLVATLHKYPDVAEKAIGKIKVEYDEKSFAVENQTIFQHLEKVAPSGEIVTENGNLEDGKKLAAQSFESTYFNHYVAHAPIETHTALADFKNDEVTIWASTQTPFRVQQAVSSELDIPTEKVRVITPFVGGGFGGKKSGRQDVEAARLTKLAGCPVIVAWNRKEEFFNDTFRPAAVIKSKSGLDDSGKIVYWDFDIFFAGTRSSEPVYDIPHLRVSARGAWRGGEQVHPFDVGAWRGPGSNTNVFGMESQIDIMAQAAGIDPLSFRLKNLKDERMKRVLESAANQFGHSFSKGPSGKGYGIACTNYLNTYLATMSEVKVDKKSGKVRVERVVCAQDTGEVINPQGIKLQIEGCITMGLGYALTEEMQFKGGKIFDENFDTYEIPRFSWLPKIEPVIVDNPDLAPQGCGEPAITSMGAVLANAVYDAIGVRLFTLPMTPERIKKAVKNG